MLVINDNLTFINIGLCAINVDIKILSCTQTCAEPAEVMTLQAYLSH